MSDILREGPVKSKDNLNEKIILIVEEGKSKVIQAINNSLIETYWNIGWEIYLNEQDGKDRASYGKQVLNNLSKVLTEKYGKGFSASNLRRMKQFYILFDNKEIYATLLRKFSWAHILEIIKIEDDIKREFYITMCNNEGWSVRNFKDRVKSMLLKEQLSLINPVKL